jgi:hypothetical protein
VIWVFGKPEYFFKRGWTAVWKNSLSGKSGGQTVTIKKTYDGTAGATHAVNYGGTVSPDVRKISGQWSTGLSRGNFVLER